MNSNQDMVFSGKKILCRDCYYIDLWLSFKWDYFDFIDIMKYVFAGPGLDVGGGLRADFYFLALPL